MVYVKELFILGPLHVLLHRSCSRSCRPAEAKTLCFSFDYVISNTIELIDRGTSVYKLVTLCRLYNSVLASISQMIVEIVIDSIVMLTIFAKFTLAWRRLTNFDTTLMLRTFDLLFLFMQYFWSGSLLHYFTPFSIGLLLSVSLYKANGFLTELNRVFFDNVANSA